MTSRMDFYKNKRIAICPTCKKSVRAIKFNIENVFGDSYLDNTIQILGCTECHNIFYHQRDRRLLKDRKTYKKSRSPNKRFKKTHSSRAIDT